MGASSGHRSGSVRLKLHFTLFILNSSSSLSLPYFTDVFDGAMIVLAVWTYNFIHPMVLPKLGPKPEFDFSNLIPLTSSDSVDGRNSQLTMYEEVNASMGELKPYHSAV